MRETLERADGDNGGAISRAEAQRTMPRVYERFDEVDQNRDGSVTPDELRAFWQERARKRRIEHGAPDPRF